MKRSGRYTSFAKRRMRTGICFVMPFVVGAVVFVLIAAPLSDVETASFAPMMVCAVAGIAAMVASEVAWQAYDAAVIRREDEKDAETVLRLAQVLRKTQRTDIVRRPAEYAAFCRAHMLTTKQRDKLRAAAEVPEAVN